jgi:hypothetical protein
LAAILGILNHLRRAVQRDLGTFEAVKLNNFFLLVALMAYGAIESGLEPKSAEPLLLLLGLLVLFPLSSDPLARIPSSRLRLWPLDRKQSRCSVSLSSAITRQRLLRNAIFSGMSRSFRDGSEGSFATTSGRC